MARKTDGTHLEPSSNLGTVRVRWPAGGGRVGARSTVKTVRERGESARSYGGGGLFCWQPPKLDREE
jgi:hypothetical protein